MAGHEFDQPLTPEQQLAAAKDFFRASMLADDMVFEVIRGQLPALTEFDRQTPDFGLEPTVKIDSNQTSKIGLLVNRSGKVMDGVIPIETTIDIHNPLPLCVIDMTGQIELAGSLEKALAATGRDRRDGFGIIAIWQKATQDMRGLLPEETVIDPASGTFVLSQISSRV